MVKGPNAIVPTVAVLVVASCGFVRDTPGSSDDSMPDPLAYRCSVSTAIPMTVVPPREADEPFVSVPTPAGWEFVARDREMVRGGLVSAELRANDFTPNAVITLADVSVVARTPQQALDAEQSGLAGEVHIDSVQDGTLCGYPARRVNYLFEGRDATTLIVAGTDGRRRTWVSTVGIQTTEPTNPQYVQDKAVILDNFQFLIRHLDDIAS